MPHILGPLRWMQYIGRAPHHARRRLPFLPPLPYSTLQYIGECGWGNGCATSGFRRAYVRDGRHGVGEALQQVWAKNYRNQHFAILQQRCVQPYSPHAYEVWKRVGEHVDLLQWIVRANKSAHLSVSTNTNLLRTAAGGRYEGLLCKSVFYTLLQNNNCKRRQALRRRQWHGPSCHEAVRRRSGPNATPQCHHALRKQEKHPTHGLSGHARAATRRQNENGDSPYSR